MENLIGINCGLERSKVLRPNQSTKLEHSIHRDHKQGYQTAGVTILWTEIGLCVGAHGTKAEGSINKQTCNSRATELVPKSEVSEIAFAIRNYGKLKSDFREENYEYRDYSDYNGKNDDRTSYWFNRNDTITPPDLPVLGFGLSSFKLEEWGRKGVGWIEKWYEKIMN